MDALKLLAAFIVQQNKKMELKTRSSMTQKERASLWMQKLYRQQNIKTRAAKAKLVAEIKRLMELDKGE